MNSMKMLAGLNKPQRKAVLAGNSAVLIVAGPGTGKTKTLTARMARLVEQGERVLALTFTNKAVREMQERTSSMLGGSNVPVIATFHGFCHRLIDRQLGKKHELIAETERLQILRSLKKKRGLKSSSTRELSLRLSRAKTGQRSEPTMKGLVRDYQNALAELALFDFDDLLIKAVELLKKGSYKPRFKHILVDEFQDTSPLQYELLKLLGADSMFAIGDPQQSIYGFRGASANVFGRFKTDWPDAKVITLPTNYRSAGNIVRIGNAIFPDSTQLEPSRQTKGRVNCVEVLNEYSEARWIIDAVEKQIGGSTMIHSHEHHTSGHKAQNFHNFAVLYRTHRTAAVLRRLLDESGLPFQVAGEGSPYSHPDVATLLGELKKKTDSKLPASRAVSEKVRSLGFDTNAVHMRMLVNAAMRFDNAGLEAYLNHIETIAEQEFYDPAADAITLLTIHAAKGLEFKHVFLIAAEEDMLPYSRKGDEPDLEEERRLFYVAATRARDHLEILHARKRVSQPAKPSRFIKDIASTLLPRIVDPGMASQQERSRKRAIKRSQATLF